MKRFSRHCGLTASAASFLLLLLQQQQYVDGQEQPSKDPSDQSDQTACGGSLICHNGGVCRQGEASWPGSGGDGDDSLPTTLSSTSNEEGFYCDCAASFHGGSFTGLSCEIPYQECQYPNGFTVCYHGGTCLDEAPPQWDSGTPVCNCEPAKHKGAVYVGRNCEVLEHVADPCEGQDSFCMNGGICIESGINQGEPYCNCPAGLEGSRCERRSKPDENDECDLVCENAGVCRFDSTEHSVGGKPQWGTRNQMFCECNTGFAGIQCEHRAQVCGDDELVCLHSSTCQAKSDGSGYECACANGDSYVGGACASRELITHCNPTDALEFAYGMAVPAFCANGGSCTEEVVDGMLMPACSCPGSFEGPHCEFVVSASEPKQPESPFTPTTPTTDKISDSGGDDDYSKAGRTVLNLLLLALFSVGTFFLVRQSIRIFRKRRRQDQVVLNLQSFREENQGAVSANGSMLFPSANNPSEQRQGHFTMGELMHDVEIS